MIDDLEQRLARLAPSVEAEFVHRRGPRWGRAAVVVAVTVTAAVGIVVAIRVRSEPERLTTASTLPSHAAAPDSVTVRQGVLELSITVDDTTPDIGTRIHVTTSVRNLGAEPLRYVGPQCGDVPTHTVLSPAGTRTPRPFWDTTTPLRDWLPQHSTPRIEPQLVPPGQFGMQALFCDDVLRSSILAAGASYTDAGPLDIRVGPNGPLMDGPLTLSASFGGTDQQGTSHTVQAQLAVTPRDPNHHLDSMTAAIDAFADDSRLQQWINALGERGAYRDQWGYNTELSWWHDAWELWMTPTLAPDRSLRMRYDPAGASVTDVRIVAINAVPDDDPDHAPSGDQAPPDTTIPP